MYSRDLDPRKRLDIAEKLAMLATDGDVEPSSLITRLNMSRGLFNLSQAPNAIWRQIVDNVHAGRSGDAGSGAVAIARLLEAMARELPGRQELLELAYQLGGGTVTTEGAVIGQARQLFLSYSSKDRSNVDALYDALRVSRPNLDIFQDHRMSPGTIWHDAISNAAVGATAMVCWVTADYKASPYCAFEIGLATNCSTRIIPVFSPASLMNGVSPPYYGRYQGIKGTPEQSLTAVAAEIITSLS